MRGNRTRWIGRFGIEVEHILHPSDIGAVDLRNAPDVLPPWPQIILGQTPAHRLARHPFMRREPDHRTGQKIECPALSPLRRVGAGGRHQQRRILAGQLTRRPWVRFLTERQFQIAFHEASFGSVNRGATNRTTGRDRFVADSGVGGEQDLRPLEFARRMLPAAQQRYELGAFRLAQFTRYPCGNIWFDIDGATGELLNRLDPSRRVYRWLLAGCTRSTFRG
jgi:hypothetical protein